VVPAKVFRLKAGLSGHLVCLVDLVHLISPRQPNKLNKPNKPNRPNEQDRLAAFSLSTCVATIATVSVLKIPWCVICNTGTIPEYSVLLLLINTLHDTTLVY
jgi:hypothetical protein